MYMYMYIYIYIYIYWVAVFLLAGAPHTYSICGVLGVWHASAHTHLQTQLLFQPAPAKVHLVAEHKISNGDPHLRMLYHTQL